MKVVQQPFCSGADVVARIGVQAYVTVRLIENIYITFQPREECRGLRRTSSGAVRVSQATAMLCKSFEAKYFSTNGRLYKASCRI